MTAHRATTRLRDTTLAGADRNFAMWIHLSPLLALIVVGPFAAVAPLVLWLVRKDTSPFADDHGREVLNMSITGAILFVIGAITGIGVIVWLIWAIIALIGIVRGAVAATAGEYFRYPMTVRFL